MLDPNVATGTRDAGNTTFTGRGTLRKTGAGELRWGTGIAAFNFGSGGLLDVQAGTFTGGSNTNEDWTTNLADLNVATGAVFSGVEANVRVDALSGAGTIRSGFNGAGYTGFTFGVDNGSGTFSGVLANDSSTGNFTKTGSGTQILSGTNTYSGTTTVNGGALLLNGSLAATSAVTVASGATLGGTGTAGGAVTVQSGGTLAPGANGVGTLTVGSAAVSGHLAVQVSGNTADRLTVTGNLDITNCTLDLSILAGGLTQLQYILASYGSLTGSQFAAVTGVPNGYLISYDTANKRIMLMGELTQAPRNLTAVGGVGRVALGWQPTVHGSETTYQIERATSSGGTFAVLTSTATGNSYTDTGVTDGTTYFYRVRVSAGGSVGPVSNEASATTATAGTLPPPLTGTSNIGGYGSPGVTYSGGTYTLNGSGSGATCTADSGYFLYVPDRRRLHHRRQGEQPGWFEHDPPRRRHDAPIARRQRHGNGHAGRAVKDLQPLPHLHWRLDSLSERHRHRATLGAHRAQRQLAARRTVRRRHVLDPVHLAHHQHVRHRLCRPVCLFGRHGHHD